MLVVLLSTAVFASSLAPIAVTGDPAPTTSGLAPTFTDFASPHVNASDAFVFTGTTTGGRCPDVVTGVRTEPTGVYFDDGSAVAVVGECGDQAVAGSATYGTLAILSPNPAVNIGGDVAFGACAIVGTAPNQRLQATYWRKDAGSARTVIAKRDTQLPGGCHLLGVSGACNPAVGSDALSLSDTGDVVFKAAVACGGVFTNALYVASGPTIVEVLHEEMPLSGTSGLPSTLDSQVIGELADYATNPLGEVLIYARTGQAGGPGVDTEYDDAVFVWEPASSSLRFVWAESDDVEIAAVPLFLSDGSVELSLEDPDGGPGWVEVHSPNGVVAVVDPEPSVVYATTSLLWSAWDTSIDRIDLWLSTGGSWLVPGTEILEWPYEGNGEWVGDTLVPGQMAIDEGSADRTFAIEDIGNGVLAGQLSFDSNHWVWLAKLGEEMILDGVHRVVADIDLGTDRRTIDRDASQQPLPVHSDRLDSGLGVVAQCSAGVRLDFEDGVSGVFLETVDVVDINNDGRKSVQDIFDFLGLWFARNLAADMNHDGTTSVQDIFDYLNLWFAPTIC